MAVCVIACVRLIAGFLSDPDWAARTYLYVLPLSLAVVLLIVIIFYIPYYIAANMRVRKICTENPNSETLKMAVPAEDVNGGLRTLGFPVFRRPEYSYVTLGVSAEGLTIMRGFGYKSAVFPADCVVDIRLEERSVKGVRTVPSYTFYIESDTDDPVRLSFLEFNQSTFGMVRVPEKRRREKLEAFVTALGDSAS